MAFKFILGHHIKKVLNDAEDKQKTNIKEYAGGHLNESVLLRAPLVLNRRPWPSAHAESIVLTQPSKPVHKPRKQKQAGTPKDKLYDFSLGTAGVLPPVPAPPTVPRTPNVRYRPCSEQEKETPEMGKSTLSSKSIYSELEDGILIEELPPQELMMPTHKPRVNQLPKDEDPTENTYLSQSSFFSRDSNRTSQPYNYSVLPMHSQGITRKDQYRKMKAFDASVLQKRELLEQNVLSGEKAARHHERKLQQDLDDLNLNGIGPNFHRLQVFSNVLDDLIEESPTFNLVLRNIKTEYDNYIAKLLDSQSSQQHLLRDQVDQMASRGTSRPGEMAGATDRLLSLEREAMTLLDDQARLKDEVKREKELLEREPEPAPKPAAGSSFIKKEQPVELCEELEHMKALILEKLDELKDMRIRLREEFVPMSVCTHLEQCIKETEVEVQKLLKQNEYFERSIGEMDTDLKQAIVEADTSEKDARRIWRKVNSTRGMPGPRQATTTESDEEDEEETKWNWYIS